MITIVTHKFANCHLVAVFFLLWGWFHLLIYALRPAICVLRPTFEKLFTGTKVRRKVQKKDVGRKKLYEIDPSRIVLLPQCFFKGWILQKDERMEKLEGEKVSNTGQDKKLIDGYFIFFASFFIFHSFTRVNTKY